MGHGLRLVLLVGALALVSAALWFLRSGRGERADEPALVARELLAETREPASLASLPETRVPIGDGSPASEVPVAPTPTPNLAPEPSPRARVEVEVLSTALEPVPGVEVLLQRGRQGHGETTDERGRVTFEGAAIESLDPLHPARICAGITVREPVWVTVDRPTPLGEPVRMILPPHGALDIEVITAEGEPVEEASVELAFAGEPRLAPGMGWMPGMRADADAGHALFPCVALDLEFDLFVASRELGEARSRVAGPVFPGQRVEHTLVLGSEATVLLFRAVDEQHRALAGTLSLTAANRSAVMRTARGESVEADAEGRFEWSLNGRYSFVERRELEIRSDERSLFARVDLSRAFPPGRVDMGDVVLEPIPLLASGRVVDPEGRPIQGVMVRAGTLADFIKADPTQFMPRFDLTAETAADGTFTLRGGVTRGPIQLRASRSGLSAESLEVALGATGVELVATATGGLAGRLLLDPGIQLGSSLAVSLRRDDRAGSVGQRRRGSGEPGSFEFAELLPGSYTFSVAADEPLVEIRGIVVASGEIARDPRIQELDLRGRVRAFTLALVKPTNASERLSGEIEFTPTGESSPVRSQRLSGAATDVQLVTTLSRIDATVRVDGYRRERLTDLGPRNEVRLRRGPCVCLALPAALQLPEAPLQLGATLVEAGDESWGGNSQFFDEHGELRCFVSGPGRYEVRWVLEHREASSSSRGGFRIDPSLVVEVREQEGEQRVVLALTNEDLARALEVR